MVMVTLDVHVQPSEMFQISFIATYLIDFV